MIYALIIQSLYSVILASSLHATVVSAAKYRVTAVDGLSLMWLPWSSRWSPIAVGSEVYENTLIQAVVPTTIDLERTEIVTGAHDENRIRLKFELPTMLRVTKPVGRSMQVGSKIIEITDILPKIRDSSKKQLKRVKPLSQAWFRTQSFISSFNKDIDLFRKMIRIKTTPSPLSLHKSLGTIKIIEPRDGGVFSVDQYPAEVAVTWGEKGIPADKRLRFVYLWQDGSQLGSPIATSKRPYAIISVSKPGSYYLGVTTGDHSVASEYLIINFQ